MNATTTILVVEDDPDIREATAALLECEGYHVDLAENGRSGLERLQQEPLPCLILLDLMMPVMNGLEFMDHFHHLAPRQARIPVVVLTASHNPCIPGAHEVMCKPYDIRRLLDMVDRCCHGDRRERQRPCSEATAMP